MNNSLRAKIKGGEWFIIEAKRVGGIHYYLVGDFITTRR